jgi:hypothetical protein
MKNELKYILETEDGDRVIKIYSYDPAAPGSGSYATGVFALQEGKTDLGDIVFDDNMKQWEYTGMGNLTHKEAGRIALFIQEKKNSRQ